MWLDVTLYAHFIDVVAKTRVKNFKTVIVSVNLCKALYNIIWFTSWHPIHGFYLFIGSFEMVYTRNGSAGYFKHIVSTWQHTSWLLLTVTSCTRSPSHKIQIMYFWHTRWILSSRVTYSLILYRTWVSKIAILLLHDVLISDKWIWASSSLLSSKALSATRPGTEDRQMTRKMNCFEWNWRCSCSILIFWKIRPEKKVGLYLSRGFRLNASPLKAEQKEAC